MRKLVTLVTWSKVKVITAMGKIAFVTVALVAATDVKVALAFAFSTDCVDAVVALSSVMSEVERLHSSQVSQ